MTEKPQNQEEKKNEQGDGSPVGMLRKYLGLRRAEDAAPAPEPTTAKEKQRGDYLLTSAKAELEPKTYKVCFHRLSEEDKTAYNEYVTRFGARDLMIRLSTGEFSHIPGSSRGQLTTAQTLKLRNDPGYDHFVDSRGIRELSEDYAEFDLETK